MARVSIQDRIFPDGECFGCGSKNDRGLQLKSLPRSDGAIIAHWRPGVEHTNGAGTVCGGVLATILDCHGAATGLHAMRSGTMLTKQFTIEFLRPTPMGELELVGRVVQCRTRSVEVEVVASAEGTAGARLSGIFVVPKSAV